MAELQLTMRGVVYPWQCDHMGHMNVMWYVGFFDQATWSFLASFGITASWMRDNRRGMVAASQKIAYKAEVLPGDVITIRTGILECKPKAIRFFHEMRNEEKGVIAAITELVGVQIDAETRKSVPLPDEIVRRVREQIVTYETGF